MTNVPKISDELAADYYRRDKKKLTICALLVAVGMAVWGTDVYVGLGDAGAPFVLLAQFAALGGVILAVITECPSCKRFNIRLPYCSVCKFPLVRKRS